MSGVSKILMQFIKFLRVALKLECGVHAKSETMVFEGTIICDHYGWLIVTPFLREQKKR
jgi:hypothetical protein